MTFPVSMPLLAVQELGQSCDLCLRRMWRFCAQMRIHKPTVVYCLQQSNLTSTAFVFLVACRNSSHCADEAHSLCSGCHGPWPLLHHDYKASGRNTNNDDSAVPGGVRGLGSMGQIWKAHRRPLEGGKARCIALAWDVQQATSLRATNRPQHKLGLRQRKEA
jgi:hypothetical protein